MMRDDFKILSFPNASVGNPDKAMAEPPTKTFGGDRFVSGQTALEYLLLFGIVAAAVLAAFKYLLPQVRDSSEGYYNSVTRVIMGDKPDPINGGWCNTWSACAPGVTTQYDTCNCPAPAFGGLPCSGTGSRDCPSS